MTRFWIVGLALLSSSTCSSPPLEPSLPPSEAALSILFVGNSLTYWNDMPGMLSHLLEEAGAGPVFVGSSSFPNYGLQDHWVDGRTHDAIALGGWDYVVLQQGPSATEGRPSLLEYTARFLPEIEAAGARPALYMVWPAASRPFDFEGVAESYALAAERVDGVLFPAGEAWQAAWSLDDQLALYGPDGFHPSGLGSYLAALTIADRLVGAALGPSHVVPTPTGEFVVPPETGALLLEAARAANAERAAAG